MRVRVVVFLAASCLALASIASLDAAKKPRTPYSYYLTGSAADVTPPTSAGTVLMGGGTDVDDAFRWQIARSGGGDFVVIRATGTNGYNKYINRLGTVDSVETLVIPSIDAANDPFVITTIANAEALFIAGGDQAYYRNYWKDTVVEGAIASLVARGVPIGGTSAGLAILGEIAYTAVNGTITSSEALANPYDTRVTLETGFVALPFLAGTVTDSHFVERDRMGRTVAFVARNVQDGLASPARAIGIDSLTALLVDGDGTVSVVGSGAAYFIASAGVPTVCAPGLPLTYANLGVYRVSAGATFDLVSWTGAGGTPYTISAQAGALSSSIATVY